MASAALSVVGNSVYCDLISTSKSVQATKVAANADRVKRRKYGFDFMIKYADYKLKFRPNRMVRVRG
ncbi:hypothetical protein D3C87_1609890 [compost metagenome]